MADVETLTRMMAEAGQLDDAIAGVIQTADDAWVFRFDDVDVELEFSPETGKLMAMSVIGQPPVEGRVAVLEALMSYSFIWRDTGGVRMAMTGPGGDIVQMADVAADHLDPTGLAVLVSNLATNTRVWRAFMASGASDNPAPNGFDPSAFIFQA